MFLKSNIGDEVVRENTQFLKAHRCSDSTETEMVCVYAEAQLQIPETLIAKSES